MRPIAADPDVVADLFRNGAVIYRHTVGYSIPTSIFSRLNSVAG